MWKWHMISSDSYFMKVKLCPASLPVSTLVSMFSHIVVASSYHILSILENAITADYYLLLLLCTSGMSRSILPASRLQLHLNNLWGSPLQVTGSLVRG